MSAKPDGWLVRFKREGSDQIDRLIVNKKGDAEKQVQKDLIISVVPIWEIKTGAAHE